MGGYGSGRWGSQRKKTQVEHCRRFAIGDLIKGIRYVEGGGGLWRGGITWSLAGRYVADITYTIRIDSGLLVELAYNLTPAGGEPEQINYTVRLTSAPLPWGGLRYWFICPVKNCGRRARKLYLAPGGKYFACRHCYNLTYKSAQEEHSGDSLWRSMAAMMQADYPGITPKLAAELFEWRGEWRGPGKPSPALARVLFADLAERAQAALAADPYPGYMTGAELCELSGLSADSLAALESVRLLIPDRPSGKYRPKLLGWAAKLAYLLGAGWNLEELRAWARGRWATDNPRLFPPRREDWIKQ